MDRSHLLAETCLQLQDKLTVAGLVIIHIGDEDDPRQTVQLAELPGLDGAGLDAGLAVDHDDRRIRSADRFLNLADKIEVSGGIKDVQLDRAVVLVGILDRDQGRADGESALLLLLVIVADRVACGDAAHLGDCAADKSHRFRDRRLSGTAVAQKNNIADLRGFVNFHNG